MAKFDIEYSFEENTSGDVELVVYIDNPDLDLSFGEPKMARMIPSDQDGSDSHYHLTVFVQEDPSGSNSEKLRFSPTRFYEEGDDQKYLTIYCATHVDDATQTTRKKRRTSTTVSNGSGG